MKPTFFSSLLWLGALLIAGAADDYRPGPEAQEQAGVPKGTVTRHRWTNSIVYPGTVRDYWIYVPRQYDPSQPACLMIFQDGASYQNTGSNGQIRVPIVLDNLIHKKEIPVMIGLFINPGEIPSAEPDQKSRSNRSFEYDSLGGQYARFLLEEMIPELARQYNIATNADRRALCGMSSGGICAFTAAWEHPEAFGKVISHIGSFTNIRGGHVYPALIRRTPAKALRVFLQDGSNDLDNLHGHWPLANQEMAASLKFAKYDHQFVLGEGGHSGRHGGAIFPDTLRWLWRDVKSK